MVKKKRLILLLYLVVFTFVASLKTFAQEKRKSSHDLKNTIHFNITNPIIFGNRSLIFGYERVINKHQSFSVNVGTNGFPKFGLIDSDSVRMYRQLKETGINISGDYRFYPAKENKHAAPRGVYFGPFYSFNSYGRRNSWTVTSTDGSTVDAATDTKLNIHTLGIELGYQFVFWNRLAVDMILIGPGVSRYGLKASLGSNLSQEDKEKLFEKINEALADKFPGYNFVVKEGEFKRTGAVNTVSFGYRYMIQVGFRF